MPSSKWTLGVGVVLTLLGLLGACAANSLQEPREVEPTLSASQGDGPTQTINPGDNIQAVVDASPPGTTFVINPGVHRGQEVVPTDGSTFVGQPGAILNGAIVLTGFSREGALWVAGVELDDAGDMHGECSDDYSGCAYSEDLFLDGTMLWHVTSRSEVGLGTWYIDYDDGLVYIADNPEGREVELSVLDSAFSGDARDVTIRGLTVEKYANAAQTGAIHAKDDESLGEGWLLEGNEIRLNHGGGIRLGPGMQVLNNFVHHNGQIGISGGEGDGIVIEGNEISFNNTAGFSWGWEAGGTKFVRTQNLVVRANHVHHNKGPGLWTDISNIHTLYEDNLVEANENMGIFHEISYDAVIRNNTVRDNGLVDHEWLLGAGILVAASRNVEVYGNTVTGNGDGIAAIQQDRGDGDYGPLQVINLYVHDNTISMTIGETGLAQDIDDDSYFRDRGNRFERNTYRLGQEENYYSWADGSRSKDEWQAFGNDTDGQWLSDAP